MKNEEISQKTKKALANSLKKFMVSKSLRKITVTDIIQDCNYNRKTFYYHFTDIYDLLKWILEREAIEVVKHFDLMIDYKEAILFVIDYVEKNAHILACAYDSMGREEMKRFLYQDCVGILQTIIDGTERELQISVAKEFKNFLCVLYTEALAGMIIDMFNDNNHYDKKQVIDYLSITFLNAIPETLKHAPKEIN